MIYQIKDYVMDLMLEEDLEEILNIYNSNVQFLLNHMDRDMVTIDWIHKEFREMIDIGFKSFKVVEKNTNRIIGIIDYKIDKETYLSLLMIHNDFKYRGIGKLIYKAFEEHCIAMKSSSIRIDVVNDYDSVVYDFWIKNGFSIFEEIEINWTGKVLPAVVMKKSINQN